MNGFLVLTGRTFGKFSLIFGDMRFDFSAVSAPGYDGYTLTPPYPSDQCPAGTPRRCSGALTDDLKTIDLMVTKHSTGAKLTVMETWRLFSALVKLKDALRKDLARAGVRWSGTSKFDTMDDIRFMSPKFYYECLEEE